MVDRPLCKPHGPRGDDRVGEVLKASITSLKPCATLRAHAIALGHERVVEEQRAGGNAARAHFFFLATDAESRRTLLDDEEIDTVLAIIPRALGRDRDEIRHVGIRAPDLGAAEPIAAGDPRSARVVIAETSEPLWASVVENAPRSAPLARPGRKRACCSRVTGGLQRPEGDPLYDQQIAGVVADSTEFLDRNAAGQQAARAAMLPRQGDCEQAELTQQLEHVLRVFGLAVDLIRARRHASRARPGGTDPGRRVARRSVRRSRRVGLRAKLDVASAAQPSVAHQARALI